MGDIRIIDFIVIVVYFGGIAALGLWFARRNRSTEEYFLGGRRFPSWAIGLSLVGTSISSVTFLAFPGDAYRTAYLRMIQNLSLPIAVVIAAIFFLPFFRQGNLTSAYEYLERRFGPSTRVYAALVFIVGQVFRIGLILFLLSLLIANFTGLSVEVSIVIAGVFVAFYTVVGGIEAVVWTDVIQTLILLAGGLVCLMIIVLNVPGGLGGIIETAYEDGKFALSEVTLQEDGSVAAEPTSFAFRFDEKTALMLLLVGLGLFLAEYSANQNVVQRYAASRSIASARQAMLICALASVPIWFFFMFLGTSLYVFFKVNPTDEATAILMGTDARAAEEILPFFMLEYMPVGLAGIVVAAVMAAAMSSLDSSINAVATVSTIDIYKRHLAPGRDDRHYLRVARYIAIAAGAAMIGIGLVFANLEQKTVQDTNIIVQSLTAGGLFGLFALGFFVPWGDGRAIAVGIVCTMTFSVWMLLRQLGLIGDWGPDIDAYYAGILGHFIMFVVGFVLGGLLPGSKRDLTGLTWWTRGAVKAE